MKRLLEKSHSPLLETFQSKDTLPNGEELFTFKPSRHCRWLFYLCMIICFIAALNLPSIWFSLLGIIFLFGYGYFLWLRIVNLKGPNVVTRLKLTAGNWMVSDSEETYPAILLGDSTITKWVSILRFKVFSTSKILTVIVFTDSLLPKLYHKLYLAARFR